MRKWSTLDAEDGRSLRSGFVRNAAETPDAPALVVRGTELTYGELDRRARSLAGLLLSSLDGRPERIGVFAYRSEAAYVGTLAALYAGAAFVPLNRTFPLRRTMDMVRLAALDAIVVDAESAGDLARFGPEAGPLPLVVAADGPAHSSLEGSIERLAGPEDVATAAALDTLPPILSDDLAYLLFTSGSTGTPKGVGVTHGNVLYFLDAVNRRLRITAGDRLSQTFDQTFDLSVFDLFMAWETGACVCVPRNLDLVAPGPYIRSNGITVWFSVPSIVALLQKKKLLRPGAMPSLRLSLFCGEPLPRSSAEAWLEAAPNSIVENLYGPTELTIACFAHRWDSARSPELCHNGIVPIGRPFDGLCALLGDADGQPIEEGDEGELLVAGPQTVPGYWLDPVRTAERFVRVDVSPTDSRRFYRTGDRVRRLANGEYCYLGRTDHQIKVLGFRVELGDIEAALKESPGVIDAVALGWPVEDGRALGVVAFVLATRFDEDAILSAAAEALPSYMVPAAVHEIDEWPVNANGKVDRRALEQILRTSGGDSVAGTVH